MMCFQSEGTMNFVQQRAGLQPS